MSTPLITIGIACFNARDTVARAIASARAQDWPHLEIIVVDDCSDDGTAAIAERAAAADARIRVLRHDRNRGVGAARATLLDAARGEYLAFFDDDDESARDRVRLQYERLAAYRASTGGAPVACYASGVRLYRNGYRRELAAIGSRERVPAGDEVVDYLLFNRRARGAFFGAGTPACALMAGVATLRAAGGFDPALRRVEDVDLAVRLARAGGHFVGCTQSLFTQHATSGPDKTARRNFDAELLLLDKHRGYLEARRRYGFARQWFAVRYHHFNGDRRGTLVALVRAWLRHPVLVTRQLLTTVPARFLHERRMARATR